MENTYVKDITFSSSVGFYDELKKQVNKFLKEKRLHKTGGWRMITKMTCVLTLFVLSYLFLVFFSDTLFKALVSGFILAQGFALLAFNVMHDSGHGSFPKNKFLKKLIRLTPDFAGFSRLLWGVRHNVLHHYYTNIDGFDDDIQIVGGIFRLSPEQKWRPCHRFQHIYAFPLYSVLTISWVLFSDFQKIMTGRIGRYEYPRLTPVAIIWLIIAKFIYLGYMVVLPLFYNPVTHVIIGFICVHLIFGFTISLVFQLAHTVEGNTFPKPNSETGFVKKEWAINQVEATADFAPTSKFANWYFGGLNLQIEHHLFPDICHVHYSAIQNIVRDTSKKFNVLYVSNKTVCSALISHYKFLKRLSESPVMGKNL